MTRLKKGVMIAEVTNEDCQKLLDEETIVMLPIGGGSKEHGGHLPMGTDFFVTDWLARAVTERFPVVTLPTLPYAYFPAFTDYKGSVSIEAYRFSSFVENILENFIKFGVKKFLILDGGVSTHYPLRIAANNLSCRWGVKVGVSNCLGLGKEAEDELCEQEKGGHGDEAETSTMLYIRGDLVRMEETTEEYLEVMPGCTKNGTVRVALFNKMKTPRGTNGNSTLATREKGERMMQAKIDDLVEFLTNFDRLEV